jgi:hypothetical protein
MRILDWDGFTEKGLLNSCGIERPLSLGIGVFDGVHRGHQELIKQVCNGYSVPCLISFRENPLRALDSKSYPGDIFSLNQKIDALEALGVALLILIDFSENFSKLTGREFFRLLMHSCRVESLALGPDFRCGRGLDTGMAEIRELAEIAGAAVAEVPPVTDSNAPVSSSRIREAILAGKLPDAARLLGRNVQIDLAGMAGAFATGGTSYDANSVHRITPPSGIYRTVIFGAGSEPCGDAKGDLGYEGAVVIDNGVIVVPAAESGKEFIPERLLFL